MLSRAIIEGITPSPYTIGSLLGKGSRSEVYEIRAKRLPGETASSTGSGTHGTKITGDFATEATTETGTTGTGEFATEASTTGTETTDIVTTGTGEFATEASTSSATSGTSTPDKTTSSARCIKITPRMLDLGYAIIGVDEDRLFIVSIYPSYGDAFSEFQKYRTLTPYISCFIEPIVKGFEGISRISGVYTNRTIRIQSTFEHEKEIHDLVWASAPHARPFMIESFERFQTPSLGGIVFETACSLREAGFWTSDDPERVRVLLASVAAFLHHAQGTTELKHQDLHSENVFASLLPKDDLSPLLVPIVEGDTSRSLFIPAAIFGKDSRAYRFKVGDLGYASATDPLTGTRLISLNTLLVGPREPPLDVSSDCTLLEDTDADIEHDAHDDQVDDELDDQDDRVDLDHDVDDGDVEDDVDGDSTDDDSDEDFGIFRPTLDEEHGYDLQFLVRNLYDDAIEANPIVPMKRTIRFLKSVLDEMRKVSKVAFEFGNSSTWRPKPGFVCDMTPREFLEMSVFASYWSEEA